MKVKFWGVRGSIPSPGPATARYGGNTSCVSVLLGDKTLVLDAGTGIRELGKHIAPVETGIFLLLTHVHWDHIQGFPYFAPLYQEGREIYILPFLREKPVFDLVVGQMDGVFYPVRMDSLPSRCSVVDEDPPAFMGRLGIRLDIIESNHPGGAFGYRFEDSGRSVVYLTDNELDPPYGDRRDFGQFVSFCRNADILIHDAQYTEEDMPEKHGWGHSLVSQACRLAGEAGAKHLVLYHHDPDRTDDQLDAIQDQARSWLKKNSYVTACTAAYEGLTLDI